MNTFAVTALGLQRSTIRAFMRARRDARRDMREAVMPFTRAAATKAYRSMTLRLTAELLVYGRPKA